jgi:hypothetical protein
MNQDWSVQPYQTEMVIPYEIGVPLYYTDNVSGLLVLGYDDDGNVYIHFESDGWISYQHALPGWLQLAN